MEKLSFQPRDVDGDDSGEGLRRWIEQQKIKDPLRITELSGERCSIDYLPLNVFTFRNLTCLSMARNELRTLPKELGSLVMLERLYVHENPLESLPSELGKLERLRLLWICDTEVKVLPTELGRLTALEDLDLCRTPLKRLPSRMAALTLLKALPLRETLGLDEVVAGQEAAVARLQELCRGYALKARRAAECVMLMRREGPWQRLPMDLVRLMSDMVWATRDEEEWFLQK